MVIKNITVDEGNLIAVINDPSVYAIKKHWLRDNEFDMVPIGDIRIEDLRNPNIAFIRIAE